MRIPEKGMDRETVFEKLESYRSNDLDWKAGRAFGYVFDAGKEAMEVGKEAFTRFMSENALDPTVFPSLPRFENDIVSMAREHLRGDENCVGTFTSGGTESIILAVKSAREYRRANRPTPGQAEIILPVTAHAAFHKAAHYLDLKVVLAPVDTTTYQADVAAMREAITENTILLVGSSPSYAHGVIDPIEEMGQLAQEKDLLFHVDGCIGAFLLPFFKRLGADIPDFDFQVPGVTSMSMDFHKYGFTPKGASVVMYRNNELRTHQYFACSHWTGYTIINPTIQSTKSGGPLAAAWAVMNYLGDDGYMELAQKTHETATKLIEGIKKIDGLYIMGDPKMSLLAFRSDTIDIFHIIDEMNERGWYVQPQLRFKDYPENIHLSVNPGNHGGTEAFLKDLQDAVEAAKQLPPRQMEAAMGGQLAQLEGVEMSHEDIVGLLGMAGIETGNKLPGRMAEINGLLNALPPAFSEKVLNAFMGELFMPSK